MPVSGWLPPNNVGAVGRREVEAFPVFRLGEDDNVQRPTSGPRRWITSGSPHPDPLLSGNVVTVAQRVSLSRPPRDSKYR